MGHGCREILPSNANAVVLRIWKREKLWLRCHHCLHPRRAVAKDLRESHRRREAGDDHCRAGDERRGAGDAHDRGTTAEHDLETLALGEWKGLRARRNTRIGN
ncbi:hypothetical protein AAHE18_05G136700 [Arachis hypogaea]